MELKAMPVKIFAFTLSCTFVRLSDNDRSKDTSQAAWMNIEKADKTQNQTNKKKIHLMSSQILSCFLKGFILAGNFL